jgi:hypothetical protein
MNTEQIVKSFQTYTTCCVIVLSSISFLGCNNEASHKIAEQKLQDSTQKLIDTVQHISIEKEESKQIDSVDVVMCSEKEMPNPDTEDPIINKTCLYKHYKTISIGSPDYKGRYSYEYKLYKKQENGTFKKVKNVSLFNEKKTELLSLINAKIKKEYDLYAQDPESSECFDQMSFVPFTFEQLGIDFDNNSINFNVTFGVGGACSSVDGTGITFSLDEIKQYMNP